MERCRTVCILVNLCLDIPTILLLVTQLKVKSVSGFQHISIINEDGSSFFRAGLSRQLTTSGRFTPWERRSVDPALVLSIQTVEMDYSCSSTGCEMTRPRGGWICPRGLGRMGKKRLQGMIRSWGLDGPAGVDSQRSQC